MKLSLSILFVVLTTAFSPLQAQSETAPVDSLCDHLFQSSNRYVESEITYRVVKWSVLSTYFDDIKALDAEKSNQIASSAKKITTLEDESKEQQAAYNELNDKYEHAIKVNDAMQIFSILIPKTQYNMIMWTLVLILIGGIIILYLMFSRGHQAINHAKEELEEKSEEFEAYRKRTLKREQEVASGYLRDIKKLKERLGGA